MMSPDLNLRVEHIPAYFLVLAEIVQVSKKCNDDAYLFDIDVQGK